MVFRIFQPMGRLAARTRLHTRFFGGSPCTNRFAELVSAVDITVNLTFTPFQAIRCFVLLSQIVAVNWG